MMQGEAYVDERKIQNSVPDSQRFVPTSSAHLYLYLYLYIYIYIYIYTY